MAADAAAAKPGAERVRQVPAREDARPTSPGYVATPGVGKRPKPSVLEPRDDNAAAAPAAPAPQPAARGSSERTAGPRGVVIAEQTVNGRFRGTITVDGETREFDTRAAFEAAKRELGQGR